MLIARLTILLLTVVAGCAQERVAHVPDDASQELSVPAERDAQTVLPDGDARAHELLRRDCERSKYGPEWKVLGPGITCLRSEECTKRPLGRCIGLPAQLCMYGTTLGAFNDHCQEDRDCVRGEHGTCPKLLNTTLCLYDSCASDSDCDSDSQCQCPDDGGGTDDPWCVVLGCDGDQDCPPGETCRTDTSVVGISFMRHCSTERDTCMSDRECSRVDAGSVGEPLLCGFDSKLLGWRCRPSILID